MRLLRGFTAILYKEFIVIFRDRATLFFMFFPPLIQIIAFGFALDNDIKHMSMIVYDEDNTYESRLLIDRFVNTQSFRVVGHVYNIDALSQAIRAGKAYVGLQIPPDYTRRLRGGQTARVQVLIDGSNSTPALQALNTSLGLGFRQSADRLLAASGQTEFPVEVRPQVLYNPGLLSPNFFIPGVIGLALQIATLFATAMSIVRERERGTLEQLLVSPVSRSGLMLGKIVPYLVVSMTMATGLFLILRWVFFIEIMGSLVALLASTLVYIFTMLSLGLLISTKAQNQMQAFQMTMTLLLPSVFFSGFIFPRETLPWIFYAISAILPATYYIELLRAIILRGATFEEYSLQFVVLTCMGALLFLLSSLRFRSRVA